MFHQGSHTEELSIFERDVRVSNFVTQIARFKFVKISTTSQQFSWRATIRKIISCLGTKKGKPLEERMMSCWLLVVSNFPWHGRIVARNTPPEKPLLILFEDVSLYTRYTIPLALGKWTTKSTSLPPTITESQWNMNLDVLPFSNHQVESKKGCLKCPLSYNPATRRKKTWQESCCGFFWPS